MQASKRTGDESEKLKNRTTERWLPKVINDTMDTSTP